MKKIHIVALIVLALGVSMIVLQAKQVTSYANFNDAQGKTEKVKVAGTLVKNKPMVYEPEKDANKFMFYLKDQNNVEIQVMLMKPKPQDFELSEQIVVTGEMKNGVFVANDVLMKCPSKYKDNEINMKKG